MTAGGSKIAADRPGATQRRAKRLSQLAPPVGLRPPCVTSWESRASSSRGPYSTPIGGPVCAPMDIDAGGDYQRRPSPQVLEIRDRSLVQRSTHEMSYRREHGEKRPSPELSDVDEMPPSQSRYQRCRICASDGLEADKGRRHPRWKLRDDPERRPLRLRKRIDRCREAEV